MNPGELAKAFNMGGIGGEAKTGGKRYRRHNKGGKSRRTRVKSHSKTRRHRRRTRHSR